MVSEYKEDSNSISLMKLNRFYTRINVERAKSHRGLKQLAVRLSELSMLFRKFLIKGDLIGFARRLTWLIHRRRIADHPTFYDVNDEELKTNISYYTENNRLAVYTSIFGDYDELSQPLFVSEYCDYYVITDQEVPLNSIWKKIEINDDEFNSMDSYQKSKYCKMFPHKILPQYKYSLWVDGNVIIVADPYPLLRHMLNGNVMSAFLQPDHECIYTEARFLQYCGRVKSEKMEEQIKFYKSEGFPRMFGMREFSIILRDNVDNELHNLMDQWWEQVNKFTMRDQISFPYILWKNSKSIEYIKCMGENWRTNPRFLYKEHSWKWDDSEIKYKQ